VLASPAAFDLALSGVLTAWEIEDLGASRLGDLFQFSPADERSGEVQVVSLHGNDGKARLTRTLADVSTFADKEFAHSGSPFCKYAQTRVVLGICSKQVYMMSGSLSSMIFIGIDDTDNLESRGTGHVAREVASNLAADFAVLGVLRHQLLVDPRIRYTSHNSSKSVVLDGDDTVDLAALCARVRQMMLADFQPGSDPGLCVARTVPASVVEFGQRAKREVLTQAEARGLAAAHGILLSGVGGDEGGVIGALAAVGLAASGEDGRYVMIGNSRELKGPQPIPAVLATGITQVRTMAGQPVTEGLVQSDKMRPARRGGCAVLFVEQCGYQWVPLKLD
jgi:hypothetical protein